MDSGFHSRPRARINGRFAKEISIVPPKTEEGIINTLITLRGNGITDGVLETISQKLRQIAGNCDITDPNAVKQYIATAKNQKTGKPLAQGTKNKFLYAYDKYCDVHQIEWIKPYSKEDSRTLLDNSRGHWIGCSEFIACMRANKNTVRIYSVGHLNLHYALS